MITDFITGRCVESFRIHEHALSCIGLSGGYAISCQSLLRYVGDNGAFITNDDHRQQFGLPDSINAEAEISNRLHGKIIKSVKVVPETGDLILYFDDGRIEMLCSSSGYENWQLEGPNGLSMVGYSGPAKKL